jgi:hypothetical protein
MLFKEAKMTNLSKEGPKITVGVDLRHDHSIGLILELHCIALQLLFRDLFNLSNRLDDQEHLLRLILHATSNTLQFSRYAP